MCKPPTILYKYKTITDDDRNNTDRAFTRRLLENGELYFSSFHELNDPNEAIFDYSADEIPIRLNKDEIDNPIYQPFLETREDIDDSNIILVVDGRTAANHVLSRINNHIPPGLLCLTEDHKNLLMFDYYGGGHKGLCIGLNWRKLASVFNESRQPRKIKYRSKPPHINPIWANNFGEVFFSKWKKYKHEKEFRLLYKPGIYGSSDEVLLAINEIIFGCAVCQDDQERVIEWTQHLEDIKFYKTFLQPRHYKLGIKRLNI
jgi:Protein of unknown function (DUF2971)